MISLIALAVLVVGFGIVLWLLRVAGNIEKYGLSRFDGRDGK